MAKNKIRQSLSWKALVREGVSGANAVVRGSVLGDGAIVEDLALVRFSVVGQNAKVQRQAMVKFSLLQPMSAAAGVMQLGVWSKCCCEKRFLFDGHESWWEGSQSRCW